MSSPAPSNTLPFTTPSSSLTKVTSPASVASMAFTRPVISPSLMIAPSRFNPPSIRIPAAASLSVDPAITPSFWTRPAKLASSWLLKRRRPSPTVLPSTASPRPWKSPSLKMAADTTSPATSPVCRATAEPLLPTPASTRPVFVKV